MAVFTLAADAGFSYRAAIEMSALVPISDVRAMCAANRCGMYGKNWSCPPYCGTQEHARAELERCTGGVLVQSSARLADDFDWQGIEALLSLHKRRFENLARQARLLYPDCLPLTAGACTLCRVCTCPQRPCRYPKRRLSSMEAYGLLVSEICVRSGLKYNYGPRTMTYTSCVLYTEKE